jgi:hypothetical protein
MDAAREQRAPASVRSGRLPPSGDHASLHLASEPVPAGGTGASVLRIRTAKEAMDMGDAASGASRPAGRRRACTHTGAAKSRLVWCSRCTGHGHGALAQTLRDVQPL